MSDGSRGYFWPLMFALLAVAIIAGGVFWLSQSSLLAVESIEVVGNQSLSEEEVMEIVGPRLYGQSLLRYSFDDVGDALRELPVVEHVEIERDFPHTVRVDIREYRPAASYAVEGGPFMTLSGEGRVLATAEGPDAALPRLMTGETCRAEVGQELECDDAIAGLKFITSVPLNLNQEFVEVEVRSGIIDASTSSGIVVHFGTMDESAYKFEVLRQLIARSIAAGEQVVIDVSVPDRPVLRAIGQPSQQEQVPGDESGGAAADAAAAGQEEVEEPLVDEGYLLETEEAWVE